MLDVNRVWEYSDRCASLLISRRKTISCAESCTGGLVAAALSRKAGISQCLIGGVVAYSNWLKQSVLQVPKDILERFGAVSQETVAAMLKGLDNMSRADLCVACSGIAGPTGGSAKKPVGTVWIGGLKNRQVFDITIYHFSGTRSDVQFAASIQMFKVIEQMLEDKW